MPISSTQEAREMQRKSVAARRRSPQQQLLELQRCMIEIAEDVNAKGSERAQAACAWERLENRLNRMRMKPEPKPIDVEASARRKQRPGPTNFDPSNMDME